LCALVISLSHPALTSSPNPSELLTSWFDIFQIGEISFALQLLTLSTQGILQFILLDIRTSVLLLIIFTFWLHFHLSFITPIDILDALLTRMDILHMSGPVQTPHLVSTITKQANFVNPLTPLLSLDSTLLFLDNDVLSWLLRPIISRVGSLAFHV
jgi:hypothetical protein